ncbi:MAG: GNAT family N-acetyltransferase [Pseudomonadota bacterium]
MTAVAPAPKIGKAEIFATLEATWPPAKCHDADGWRVGEGRGGGQRVSAAKRMAPEAGLRAMERKQMALGQPPLVMVREGEDGLDAALEARGYTKVDPTLGLLAPLRALPATLPPLMAFEVAWPPLARQREIWAAGGIGPGRLAVMNRVAGPRVAFLGRAGDAPAATAFAACHGRLAMVHALEVAATHRRSGLGRALMVAAVRWAAQQGAEALAVLVTRANMPALALYRGLGLRDVTSYHYRLGGRGQEPAPTASQSG